jgi:hypothetical protein
MTSTVNIEVKREKLPGFVRAWYKDSISEMWTARIGSYNRGPLFSRYRFEETNDQERESVDYLQAPDLEEIGDSTRNRRFSIDENMICGLRADILLCYLGHLQSSTK